MMRIIISLFIVSLCASISAQTPDGARIAIENYVNQQILPGAVPLRIDAWTPVLRQAVYAGARNADTRLEIKMIWVLVRHEHHQYLRLKSRYKAVDNRLESQVAAWWLQKSVDRLKAVETISADIQHWKVLAARMLLDIAPEDLALSADNEVLKELVRKEIRYALSPVNYQSEASEEIRFALRKMMHSADRSMLSSVVLAASVRQSLQKVYGRTILPGNDVRSNLPKADQEVLYKVTENEKVKLLALGLASPREVFDQNVFMKSVPDGHSIVEAYLEMRDPKRMAMNPEDNLTTISLDGRNEDGEFTAPAPEWIERKFQVEHRNKLIKEGLRELVSDVQAYHELDQCIAVLLANYKIVMALEGNEKPGVVNAKGVAFLKHLAGLSYSKYIPTYLHGYSVSAMLEEVSGKMVRRERHYNEKKWEERLERLRGKFKNDEGVFQFEDDRIELILDSELKKYELDYKNTSVGILAELLKGKPGFDGVFADAKAEQDLEVGEIQDNAAEALVPEENAEVISRGGAGSVLESGEESLQSQNHMLRIAEVFKAAGRQEPAKTDVVEINPVLNPQLSEAAFWEELAYSVALKSIDKNRILLVNKPHQAFIKDVVPVDRKFVLALSYLLQVEDVMLAQIESGVSSERSQEEEALLLSMAGKGIALLKVLKDQHSEYKSGEVQLRLRYVKLLSNEYKALAAVLTHRNVANVSTVVRDSVQDPSGYIHTKVIKNALRINREFDSLKDYFKGQEVEVAKVQSRINSLDHNLRFVNRRVAGFTNKTDEMGEELPALIDRAAVTIGLKEDDESDREDWPQNSPKIGTGNFPYLDVYRYLIAAGFKRLEESYRHRSTMPNADGVKNDIQREIGKIADLVSHISATKAILIREKLLNK